MSATVVMPEHIEEMTNVNTLFVYGIFLGETMRENYGMTKAEYAVVPDYLTTHLGSSIVEAQPAPEGYGIYLTGLCVEVNPVFWPAIDRLETGYERIRVQTSNGEAWIYARPKGEQ